MVGLYLLSFLLSHTQFTVERIVFVYIHFVKFKWKFAVQLIHRITCLRGLGTYCTLEGKAAVCGHHTYIIHILYIVLTPML